MTENKTNTIYLHHGDEHIKLIQHEPNGLIYVRSVFGDEALIPAEKICDIFSKMFDKKAIKAYQEKELKEGLTDKEKENLTTLIERQ